MQAIILAAGMGRRLAEKTKDNTKCMVEVNGVKLVDRLIVQLSQLSLSKIIFVIGYKGDNLRLYLEKNYSHLPLEFIYNPIYNKGYISSCITVNTNYNHIIICSS